MAKAKEQIIRIRISTRTPKLKKQFEKSCKQKNISVNKRLQELMAKDVMKFNTPK